MLLRKKEEIRNWLDKHNIRDYQILLVNYDKYVVNVNGNVNLKNKNLFHIEVQFNEVNGNFDCSHNELISLEGCAKIINGNFNCSNNKLVSFKYSPDIVNGNFNCGNNNFTDNCFTFTNGRFNSVSKNLNLTTKTINVVKSNMSDVNYLNTVDLNKISLKSSYLKEIFLNLLKKIIEKFKNRNIIKLENDFINIKNFLNDPLAKEDIKVELKNYIEIINKIKIINTNQNIKNTLSDIDNKLLFINKLNQTKKLMMIVNNKNEMNKEIDLINKENLSLLNFIKEEKNKISNDLKNDLEKILKVEKKLTKSL